MNRAANVISISSDEEEEEKNASPNPPKVEEVTLIAINSKRKRSEDIEDDLVVVEIHDKEPLEEVTTYYENQITQKTQPTKKPEKNVGPLIDLLSEEEEDEEIIFRPVTLSPKPKRIKPTKLMNHETTKRNNLNMENGPNIIKCTDTNSTNKNNSAGAVEMIKDPLMLTDLLATSAKPSIMTKYMISQDITKDIRDKMKENVAISDSVQTKSLPNVARDDDLNETVLVENANDAENNNVNDEDSSSSNSDKPSSPSTSKPLDKSPEASLQRYKTFLRICGSKITEVKTKKTFREKHPKFMKSYKVAGDFVNTNDFQTILCEATDVIKTGSNYDIIKEVMKVYNVLKENRIEPTRTFDQDEKLDHLYELLKQFTDRIKSLECVEVDYNDEENSAYCQLQTYCFSYRAKAVKVHERICEREKKSKYLDRMTYAKLDFDRSSYQAINIAINKKYKNNSVFPTFTDLDRLIRKTIKNNQIEMSEISLKEEIKTCFVLLGELLQRRRRHELLDSLSDYVDPKLNDPAAKDPDLDRKLRENKRIARQKTEEIVEKYCKIQESGMEPDLSSDPDDSNVEENSSTDEEN